jgi:hypothetical protein
MYINANRIYLDGIRYAQQIPAGTGDTEPGQSATLVSIIFAALSVETFTNEIAFHAERECWRNPHTAVQTFANILKDMENNHAPITSKLHMGSFLLAGKAFDKGSTTFQNFASLIKLRNEVVHQKPFEDFSVDDKDNQIITKHDILKLFAGKNVLGKRIINGQECHMDWLDEVSTRAMAIWGCAAASGIVNAMLDAALNTGHFGKSIDNLYRLRFNVKP